MRGAAWAIVCAAPAAAQTTDELVNDGRNTDNVTTQSTGYDRKNYSPLSQINCANITRLVPVWSASLMNDAGELSAPTIHNGVMYVVNGKWSFAIDVETGRQIWRTPVEVAPDVQRVALFGAINRGAGRARRNGINPSPTCPVQRGCWPRAAAWSLPAS